MAEQGGHYKTVPGEQHHERVHRLGLNWYAANITKYAERAPHKGQLVEDLIKVIDYACMWLAHHNLTQEQVNRLRVIVKKLAPDPSEPTSSYTNQL